MYVILHTRPSHTKKCVFKRVCVYLTNLMFEEYFLRKG